MSTPITLTGAYTCTHHNDKQRAACPVCLVTALTTERDQLRTELAEWQASAHLKGEAIDSLLVECDRLRADCENETKWASHYLAQSIADKARAERAEAELAAERARTKQIATALTDAISTYFGADKLVTAERIEAWQAALKEDDK